MRTRLLTVLVLGFLACSSFAILTSPRPLPTLPAGRIVPIANMTAARHSHTATLLPNGKVLIAGGMPQNGVFLDSAEIYDPAARRFTSAGHMNFVRGYGSTATLLPNGKVLIAGGRAAAACTAAAELYDPASGLFATTGAMNTPRCQAIAALLPTGDVLIAGGDLNSDDSPLSTAELYHPATGKFTAAGNMQTGRTLFVAVSLKDGKVLVIGGANAGHALSSAEVYDPATRLFSAEGNMHTGRHKLGAALLPDGKVLIAGGQTDGPWGNKLSSTEIFDPAKRVFTPGPNMASERFKLLEGAVTLGDGRILIAGGSDRPEVYDPTSKSFPPATGEKLDSYYFSTTTLLPNGEVLIAGGYGQRAAAGALNHAWIYEP